MTIPVNPVSVETSDPSGKAPSLTFEYGLTYQEAYEAFLLLGCRRSQRTLDAVSVLLLILAAVLTVFYALYPYRLEYFLLPLLTLVTFAGIRRYPKFKARHGARNVADTAGRYRVNLYQDGGLAAAGTARQPLAGDRDARAYETESIFVIRPDRDRTFCLPKRIMKESEAEQVRRILRQYLEEFENRSV